MSVSEKRELVLIREEFGFPGFVIRSALPTEINDLAAIGGRSRPTLKTALDNPNLRANLDLWVPFNPDDDKLNPEFVLAETLAKIGNLGVSITESTGETVFIRVSPKGRESLARVFRTLEYHDVVVKVKEQREKGIAVDPENLRQQIAAAINEAFLPSR